MKTCVFLISLCFFLISCEGDYDIGYEWVGMEAYNADNYTSHPEISLSDSIAKEVYVLRLDMITVELYRNGRYLDTETPPTNVNSLEKLVITSNTDFDASHIVGAELNDLFTIFNESYFHTLPADGSEGYYITNVHSPNFYDEPNPTHIDLILNTPPTSTGLRTFYVECTLRDGTVYQDSTTINLY
ncbi:MAG: DUF5034 domain-containing protein [Crocinitomicaceae bacterium]|nr:DUF5034 domain-containing protein [Crocinitomicaceae bacterium]